MIYESLHLLSDYELLSALTYIETVHGILSLVLLGFD